MRNKIRTLREIFAIWLMIMLFFAFFSFIPENNVLATGGTAGDGLIVTEQNTGKQWSTSTQLNIFNVIGKNKKIISPRAFGTYSFKIENRANFPLSYALSIKEENIAGIPIVFRLRDGDEKYLIGDNNTWIPINALSEIFGELKERKNIIYTLEWKWDSENDFQDTLIGIAAREGIEYTLTLNIESKQIGPEVIPSFPSTGESSPFTLWLYFVVATGAILFIIGRAFRSES